MAIIFDNLKVNIKQLLQKSVDNKRNSRMLIWTISSEGESGLLALLIRWYLSVFIYRQNTGPVFVLGACILEDSRFEREFKVTGFPSTEHDLV